MLRSITIKVVRDDATKIMGDILALKYAQARYGIDAFVFERLIEAGQKKEKMSPEPGAYSLLPSVYGIAVKKIFLLEYALFGNLDTPKYVNLEGLH